jgi:hypothetical protein
MPDCTKTSSLNGLPIILSSCNSSNTGQQWRIAGGRITAPALGNKCLTVRGNNSANGTAIESFDCVLGGQANQAWTVDRGEIRGLLGKCLTVRGNNSANGTAIELFECVNGFNQKWIVD